MKKAILLLSILAPLHLLAQLYEDPAQKYNKGWVDKIDNTVTIIGAFRVLGTPFLYGEKNKGKVWAKEGYVSDVLLSFNTYHQELAIYVGDQPKPMYKELATVDSFQMKAVVDQYGENLLFVNGRAVGLAEEAFLQVVYPGKYALYKLYKSELGNVTSNFAQGEYRQFDLNYQYYCLNKSTGKLIKLKANWGALRKEFKQVANFDSIVEAETFSTNPEEGLKRLFTHLNSN